MRIEFNSLKASVIFAEWNLIQNNTPIIRQNDWLVCSYLFVDNFYNFHESSCEDNDANAAAQWNEIGCYVFTPWILSCRKSATIAGWIVQGGLSIGRKAYAACKFAKQLMIDYGKVNASVGLNDRDDFYVSTLHGWEC